MVESCSPEASQTDWEGGKERGQAVSVIWVPGLLSISAIIGVLTKILSASSDMSD